MGADLEHVDHGRDAGPGPRLPRHRPDLRGSGYSEKPLSGYDKRTMAEDVHALVTTLGYDTIKLVSHDMGGAVAYAYAVTYQAEVEKAAFYEILVPGFGGLEGRLGFPFPTDMIGRQVWHMTFHNAPYGIPEFLIQGRESGRPIAHVARDFGPAVGDVAQVRASGRGR